MSDYHDDCTPCLGPSRHEYEHCGVYYRGGMAFHHECPAMQDDENPWGDHNGPMPQSAMRVIKEFADRCVKLQSELEDMTRRCHTLVDQLLHCQERYLDVSGELGNERSKRPRYNDMPQEEQERRKELILGKHPKPVDGNTVALHD